MIRILILVIFGITSLFQISCNSPFHNNTKNIVGDWELVSLESASSGNTSADRFQNMATNSLNSMMESMKIVYSFSSSGRYMTYGTLRGLKELSNNFMTMATAKNGTYEINGNILVTSGDDGMTEYKIIEVTSNSLKLQGDDGQTMVFKATSKEIEQNENQKEKEYSELIKGKWEIISIKNENNQECYIKQSTIIVINDRNWYYIKNGIESETYLYKIMGNKFLDRYNSKVQFEIVELTNDKLVTKVNEPSEEMVNIITTFRRIE